MRRAAMGIRGRSDGNIADAEIQNGKMLYPLLAVMAQLEAS